MIQGGLGTLVGLGVLYLGYYSLLAQFSGNLTDGLLTVRFFSPSICLAVVLGGIFVGWLGSLVSLKQFMKV